MSTSTASDRRDTALKEALKDIRLWQDKAFVDGQWLDAEERFSVLDPADGGELGSVSSLSAADSRKAVDAAQRAFRDWSSRLPQERSAILQAWHKEVLANRDDLALLMTREQGKSLDEAIKAKFATSGQDCLAANRFLVERSVHDRFSQAFADASSSLSVGPGMQNNHIGPLINEKAVLKQEEQIADALECGATLLCGGKRHAAGPLFFEPTVLCNVPIDARIMREETFGPVAAFSPFDTEEEAIQRANDSEYGLVAYLHTEDPRRIHRASRALEFGMVAVNRTKVTGAPIPFGGVKQSGLGREGSRLGLEEFTNIKYVCRDWS